jgi:putative membrane protein
MEHNPTIPAEPANLPTNWAALIETVLLGGIAAMLLTKTLRGILVFYIHPRFTPLVVVCGAALLLVAGIRLRSIVGQAPEPLLGRRTRYLVLTFALLLGTLVPARPLGADTLAGAALGTGLPMSADMVADGDSQEWDLLEWMIMRQLQGDALQGKPADVIGFVYHNSQRPHDGFFVVRYVLSCCTADSNGAGLPVVWQNGATLPANSWVRVRGSIGLATIGDQRELAVLATTVDNVPQPANPYLYLSP